MSCETNDIPVMGIMGIVLHKMLNTAKGMYQEFDLNRSQAAILFTLHRRKSISQKELAGELNMTPQLQYIGDVGRYGRLYGACPGVRVRDVYKRQGQHP